MVIYLGEHSQLGAMRHMVPGRWDNMDQAFYQYQRLRISFLHQAVIPRYSEQDQNYRHPFPKEHIYLYYLISVNTVFTMWMLKTSPQRKHILIKYTWLFKHCVWNYAYSHSVIICLYLENIYELISCVMMLSISQHLHDHRAVKILTNCYQTSLLITRKLLVTYIINICLGNLIYHHLSLFIYLIYIMFLVPGTMKEKQSSIRQKFMIHYNHQFVPVSVIHK